MQILHNTNYDFIRWRWHALILSSALIIGGLIFALAKGGVRLGIDFSGGTLVVLQFDQRCTRIRSGKRSTRCPATRSCRMRRRVGAPDHDPPAAGQRRREGVQPRAGAKGASDAIRMPACRTSR
jgi:hypothetical protein